MDTAHAHGRIGPNAIIRLAEALRFHAPGKLEGIFASAGLGKWASHPPQEMVPEADVCGLHAALRDAVGEPLAQDVARTAGHLTGGYLLSDRIPRPAQGLIRLLPARTGLRLLMAAIRRNAWTFAGTGTLHVAAWHPLVLEIADCPLCHGHSTLEPCCGYYAATFEQLFRQLVAPAFRFEETACMALDAPRCRFEEVR